MCIRDSNKGDPCADQPLQRSAVAGHGKTRRNRPLRELFIDSAKPRLHQQVDGGTGRVIRVANDLQHDQAGVLAAERLCIPGRGEARIILAADNADIGRLKNFRAALNWFEDCMAPPEAVGGVDVVERVTGCGLNPGCLLYTSRCV